MVGQQEVLVQSPVQEGSDAAHLDHGQVTDLVQGELGFLAGGDQPVLGILVQKYLQLIADRGAFRHLRAGQEHALVRNVPGQVDPEGHLFIYF